MASTTLTTIGVMVTVLSATPDSQAPRVWETTGSAPLAQAVEQWAKSEGFKTLVIAPSVAGYDLGSLNLTASDLCTALGRVVAGLRYADPQPHLVTCDQQQGRIEIGVADTMAPATDGGESPKIQ